jgi:hypothetical protein
MSEWPWNWAAIDQAAKGSKCVPARHERIQLGCDASAFLFFIFECPFFLGGCLLPLVAADAVCHVIDTHLNPHFLSCVSSCAAWDAMRRLY